MGEKLKIILLFLIGTTLLFLIVFLALTKPILEIKYNNKELDRVVEIKLGEEFTPFVSAKYLKKDISTSVIKIGDYDNTKVGEYKIVYQLNKNIYKMNKTIFVKVIDDIPPVINLNGNNPVNVCNVHEYVEEGYTATDNYDNEITDNVNVIYRENKIIYEVEDSSNNKTSVERIVITDDKEKPKISLKNGGDIFLKLNDNYVEYGYDVSDNCDKKLDNIKVSGTVDTSKAGKNEIIYSVCDRSENCSSIKRNVYVYDNNSDDNSKGTIYLTFDDGPSSYTSKILDVLDKYGVKATFFVTNSGKDELIKREYQSGHTVALHTASHSYKRIYSSVDAYFDDLESVQNRVYKITGEKSMILRFPGGSSNTVSKSYSKGIMTELTKKVHEIGYHYFDWNISVGDAGNCANKSSYEDKKNCVYDNFVKGLSKSRSNVVLMHDIKSFTADKLEDMIKYAISNGYGFKRITMNTNEVHHKVNN